MPLHTPAGILAAAPEPAQSSAPNKPLTPQTTRKPITHTGRRSNAPAKHPQATPSGTKKAAPKRAA